MRSSKRFADLCFCLLLVSAVFGLYGQVAAHRFVLFDDPSYVTDNYFVLHGLTWEGIAWALTSCDLANWHPLTLLSHMLDVEVWGLRAGGHALDNVLLHACTSVVLYFVATRLTGRSWLGFAVALLFAIHPANVESVAWISQRKSVLSALFWCVTLSAYLAYVAKPTPWRYALVVLGFALALMSKSAVVTLPCVLFLLDWWPLGRLRVARRLPQFAAGPVVPAGEAPSLYRLIGEKLPLLGMSAVVCIVTFWAQKNADAMPGAGVLSVWDRIGHAGVAIPEYLKLFVLPGKLSVFYPLAATVAPGFAGGLCLGGALAVAWLLFRFFPPGFVGWSWFLGVLVPMSGLIQVGSQRMADRYLYLPMIGLALGLAWSVAALPARWRRMLPVLGLVALPWLVWLAWRTHAQVGTWQDDWTLCEQTGSGSSIPHLMANNLAVDAVISRRESEAANLLERFPVGDSVALRNLGVLSLQAGCYEAAIALLAKGVADPKAPAQAHFHLAQALVAVGRLEEARNQLALCRSKIPRQVQWRNSLELLRLRIAAPGFSVEPLAPGGAHPGQAATDCPALPKTDPAAPGR